MFTKRKKNNKIHFNPNIKEAHLNTVRVTVIMITLGSRAGTCDTEVNT